MLKKVIIPIFIILTLLFTSVGISVYDYPDQHSNDDYPDQH